MSRLPGTSTQRLASALLVGLAVLFVGVGAPRLATEGGVDVLTLPLVLLLTDLFIAAVLLSGWYPVRPVAQGLAIFGALVHLLVLLRSGPWWLRGCSALLAVAHGYALVLLFQLSVREQRRQEALEPAEYPVPLADTGRGPGVDSTGPGTAVEPEPRTARHPEPGSPAEPEAETEAEVAARHEPAVRGEPTADAEPVAEVGPVEAEPVTPARAGAEPSVEPEPEPVDNEEGPQPVGSTVAAPLTSTSEELAR